MRFQSITAPRPRRIRRLRATPGVPQLYCSGASENRASGPLEFFRKYSPSRRPKGATPLLCTACRPFSFPGMAARHQYFVRITERRHSCDSLSSAPGLVLGLCFLWPLSKVGSFFRVARRRRGSSRFRPRVRTAAIRRSCRFRSAAAPGRTASFFRAGMASFGNVLRLWFFRKYFDGGEQGLIFFRWSPKWVRFFEWPGSGGTLRFQCSTARTAARRRSYRFLLQKT